MVKAGSSLKKLQLQPPIIDPVVIFKSQGSGPLSARKTELVCTNFHDLRLKIACTSNIPASLSSKKSAALAVCSEPTQAKVLSACVLCDLGAFLVVADSYLQEKWSSEGRMLWQVRSMMDPCPCVLWLFSVPQPVEQ